jgi:hypothetical protein
MKPAVLFIFFLALYYGGSAEAGPAYDEAGAHRIEASIRPFRIVSFPVCRVANACQLFLVKDKPEHADGAELPSFRKPERKIFFSPKINVKEFNPAGNLYLLNGILII